MCDNGFTPDFYRWLTQHTDLIQYLQIDHVRPDTNLEEMKFNTFQTAANLINFYNLNLLAKRPVKPDRLALPPADYGTHAIDLTRRINFLRLKGYKIHIKSYERACQICNDFIQLYQTPNLLPSNLILNFKESLFFYEALKEPVAKTRLLSRADFLESMLTESIRSLHFPSVSDSFENILFKILKDTTVVYDKELHYFPLTRYQTRFDQWLFSLQNPMLTSLQAFLQEFSTRSHKEFTSCVISLFKQFLTYFRTNDSTKISIMIIYFFRSIFSESYSRNPHYFMSSQHSVLPFLHEHLTIDDLNPPQLYIGSHSSTDSVTDVFTSIPSFKSIISSFSSISFCTNPIDALYEVHKVLMCVQDVISETNKKHQKSVKLFEFETIFSLFFGIVVSSDIPNFEEIAKFIIDFVPESSLSPSLSYANVTISASLAHCLDLYQNLTKTGEDLDDQYINSSFVPNAFQKDESILI